MDLPYKYRKKNLVHLYAGLVWTWYLFCEMASEETMALTMANERVKTENKDQTNLKVAGQDGSGMQFKIKSHTPLVNE